MKRDLLNKALIVLFACFACSLSTQAQLLTESFNYSTGDLYGQGNWWQYGSYSGSPDYTVKVIEASLSYQGYQDEPDGYAVELNNATMSQSVVKKFAEGEAGINSGSIYYSALLQVKEVKDVKEKPNFIMAFIRSTYSGDIVDKSTRTEVAKLFVQKGSTDDKFILGVDRSMLSPAMTTDEYDLNKTYLIIVKYEVKDGDNNDEISLFVNPTDFEQEPAEASALYKGESGGDIKNFFIHAIELRQGATSTKTTPHVIVDELRVATSYAELFKSAPPVPPVDEPEITCNPKSSIFGNVYTGETYTQDIVVKGKNLKGDITVGGLTSGEVIASTTTIPKAEAESEDGYKLTLTLNPVDPDKYSESIIFSSEGMEDVTILAYWGTIAVKNVADISGISKEDFTNFAICRITGEVTISHKQVIKEQTYYYLQDENKGIYILNTSNVIKDTNLKAGTKIKNLIAYAQDGGYIIPVDGVKLYDIVSQDNVISPKIVTLSELVTDAAKYKDMLVKVNNVELGWMKEENFESVVAGDIFINDPEHASIRTIMKDANGTMAPIRMFDDVDIIGTPVPATANVAGLSTSAGGNLISPRSLADIEKLTDPVSIKDNKANVLSVSAGKGMIQINGANVRKAELYDITGSKITETTAQELSGLAPALYLIKITTAEGTVVKKVYVK